MYWFYSTYVYITTSTIHHSVIEYRQSQYYKYLLLLQIFPVSVRVFSCFQESLKLIYISSQSEVCFTRSDWNYTNLLSAVPVLLWLVFIQITPDIGLFFSLMRFVLEKLMHYHYYFSALPAIWLENCNCKLSLVEFNISKNKIVRNTQQKF